jgi:gliding motility-associated-like protein
MFQIFNIQIPRYFLLFAFLISVMELYSIHPTIYRCKDDGVIYFMTSQQGNPNSWEWRMEGGTPDIDYKDTTDPVYYHTPGTYKTYNKTGFPDGSFSYDTFLVIVLDRPMPQFYFPTDTGFCAGGQITLNTTTFANLYYQWSTGATTGSISVNSPGKYSVTLEIKGGTEVCQTVLKEVNVTEYPSPSVNLGKDKTMCQNQLIPLDAGGGTGYTYVWSPNAEVTRTIQVSLPGIYKVRVTNAKGCFAEDEVEMIDSCPHYVFVPNAVSPNEDRLNDLFIKVLNFTPRDYTFRIFNRWGQLLFETNNFNEGWDCKAKGELVQQDIYMYKITYVDNDKKPYEMRGTFYVVR